MSITRYLMTTFSSHHQVVPQLLGKHVAKLFGLFMILEQLHGQFHIVAGLLQLLLDDLQTLFYDVEAIVLDQMQDALPQAAFARLHHEAPTQLMAVDGQAGG